MELHLELVLDIQSWEDGGDRCVNWAERGWTS